MTLSKEHFRVGVIGTGKHGSRYARHIVSDVERLELAAVSRRSQGEEGLSAVRVCEACLRSAAKGGWEDV